MRGLAHRFVHARMFEYFLALLIIGTSVCWGCLLLTSSLIGSRTG